MLQRANMAAVQHPLTFGELLPLTADYVLTQSSDWFLFEPQLKQLQLRRASPL